MTTTSTRTRPTATTADPSAAARVLGVAPGVDESTLRAAYRTAARAAHPDRGGSAERFTEVRDSYELLLYRLGADRSRLRVDVRRGPVVWIRSHVRVRMLLLAVVLAAALVGAAMFAASAVAVSVMVTCASAALGRALYLAAGRPNPAVWRWEVWRRRRPGRTSHREPPTVPIDLSAIETGPIPAMTEERMRQYEQTGR